MTDSEGNAQGGIPLSVPIVATGVVGVVVGIVRLQRQKYDTGEMKEYPQVFCNGRLVYTTSTHTHTQNRRSNNNSGTSSYIRTFDTARVMSSL